MERAYPLFVNKLFRALVSSNDIRPRKLLPSSGKKVFPLPDRGKSFRECLFLGVKNAYKSLCDRCKECSTVICYELRNFLISYKSLFAKI